MANTVFVNERNYDVAIIGATDTKGHGRLGWINNEAGEMVLAKKEFTFEAGQNNEHQAAVATLTAEKLVGMVTSGAVKEGTNVLLVLPDSLAPRFFEARKVMNQHDLDSDDAIENAVDDVIQTISKDWMSEYWLNALADLACAYGAALGAGANVGAVKKSEIYERELVSTLDNGAMAEDEAIKEGAKITVDKDGNIAETELYKAQYLRAGTYTVIDRSYDTKKGKVLQFSVNRWEAMDEKFIPNAVANLMDLNKAVSDALPKAKRLTVSAEA